MEKQFQLLNDGQAVTQDDINQLGSVEAHVDDHVFAELFRLKPTPDGSTISRGIIPYGSALIVPNGASGSVLVNPFRALIGSRTVASSNALLNWNDVRAALAVADGDTALTHTISFPAQGGGQGRWDAIYATVSVDANSASVERKVKDPSSGVVTSPTVVTTLITSVTIGVVRGTASGSPVWPSIPADSGSNYNILLGYVCVPNGFTISSTVNFGDIYEAGPVLHLGHATGALTVRAPNQLSQLTTARQELFGPDGAGVSGGTDGRAPEFLPSTMAGGASLFFSIDQRTGTTTYTDGEVIDDSQDWRNRFFRCDSAFATSVAGVSPTGFAAASSSVFTPGRQGQTYARFMGQTFQADGNGLAGPSVATSSASNTCQIYVDLADGKLKIHVPGTLANKIFFFWVDFTAQFAAY